MMIRRFPVSISHRLATLTSLVALGACVTADPEDLDAEALDAEFEVNPLEPDDLDAQAPDQEQPDRDASQGPGDADDLAAAPDSERACCIETCSASSEFCYDSVIDEHSSRCNDAVIDNTAACGLPTHQQSPALQDLCLGMYGDCMSFDSAWGSVNNWFYQQVAGCEAGFSNCMINCPV